MAMSINQKRTAPQRRIAIGDIHGRSKLLIALVEDVIRFNPNKDELIFLGDYINAGPDSAGVIDYLTRLRDNNPEAVILLKGNAEYDAHFMLSGENRSDWQRWAVQGATSTVASFGSIETARNALLPFIAELKIYYETADHIFVHAGIPKGKTLETASDVDLLNERSPKWSGPKRLIVGHTNKDAVTKTANRVFVKTWPQLSGYDVLNDKIYEAE